MMLVRNRRELSGRRILGQTAYSLAENRSYICGREGWLPFVGGTHLLDARALDLVRLEAPRVRPHSSLKFWLEVWKTNTGWNRPYEWVSR